MEIIITQIVIIQKNPALLRIIVAVDQTRNGGLAAAGRANQSRHATGINLKIKITDGGPFIIRIIERNILKFYLAGHFSRLKPFRIIANIALRLE